MSEFVRSVGWQANDARYELKLYKGTNGTLSYVILKNGEDRGGGSSQPRETEQQLIDRIIRQERSGTGSPNVMAKLSEREKADLLGERLVGGATQVTAGIIEDLASFAEGISVRDEACAVRLLIETMVFYMHLVDVTVDGMAFSSFGKVVDRDSFMDRVIVAVQKELVRGLSRELSADTFITALRDTYNRRQMEYFKCAQTSESADKLWRVVRKFTQILFGLLNDQNPMTAVFLNTLVVDYTKTMLEDVLKVEELLSENITSPTEPTPPMESLEIADFLTIVISKEDVEAADISGSFGVLARLIESPKTARQFAERVDIAFHGYDDVTFELFEIPAVRSFVYKLDGKFPYWLFFLSKHHLGLQCVLLCFLPPSLTETARAQIFRKLIGDHLTRRWFPAMNHICRYAGFSEQEVNALTDRVEAYITYGRLPLE